ncbi:hypothetical protein TYRP_018183 [Tyrophagus putrescentiae]|nr:hypothetical protein TYRP_018183 [Tyrophagus putrescentiae]
MISALEILYQFDIFRAPAVNTVATTTSTSSSAATVATMMMLMMLMVMLMMFVVVLMMDCLRHITLKNKSDY